MTLTQSCSRLTNSQALALLSSKVIVSPSAHSQEGRRQISRKEKGSQVCQVWIWSSKGTLLSRQRINSQWNAYKSKLGYSRPKSKKRRKSSSYWIKNWQISRSSFWKSIRSDKRKQRWSLNNHFNALNKMSLASWKKGCKSNSSGSKHKLS